MSAHSEPPIVGIGASAGGISALQMFFKALPSEPNATFVVIVHLDPEFRSQLPSILATCTDMPVSHVEGSAKLQNNHVYVISPDRQLVIADHTISASPFDEPRAQRAPINSFFRSLADHHTDGFAYAVILTGAGADGAQGVKAIKGSGGIVLVQDPNEAEYASMPRNAIASGDADFVLPVRDLAVQLVELLNDGYKALGNVHEQEEDLRRRILGHLRLKLGHDFSLYKRATILRRIARRVQVTRKDTLADYFSFLRENAEEAQALFSEFLIPVTTFFRDRSAFDTLALEVVPQLFEGKDVGSRIRIWVAGCATGEEVYSIGMLILEEAARRNQRPDIQVFGSDLDASSLSIGREGRFPLAIEADVSEERLRRFFQREGDHYRVRQELRDVVLFASHSILRDPPFSQLDMISCRNLLIYLDRELQQQVCNTFHYALNPGGVLFLGASESADHPAGLFSPLHRDAKIYRSNATSGLKRPALPMLLGSRILSAEGPVPPLRAEAPETTADPALHLQMLERIAPPSMLVDAAYRAIHVSRDAGRFLRFSEGSISTDASEIVREELRFDLRTALHRAFDRGESSLSMPLAVQLDGSKHRVYLQVKPVVEEKDPVQFALVIFIEGETIEERDPGEHPLQHGAGADEAIKQLQEELQLAYSRLRVTREESSTATEELRAANEELQSINEEYRSTSEELETSKEELQSINEELQTVNNELKLKLESVSRAHSDLQNLMAATDFGTLFLDPSLRIKRFTPRLTELFNVTASDEGRPITDFTHQLNYDGLPESARAVLTNLVPLEREVQSVGGRWFVMRIRPYRTIDDKIDGVVATFLDITDRKHAEDARLRSDERLRQFGEASQDVLWIRDAETLQWQYLTPAFETIYGLPRDEALSGNNYRSWLDLMIPEDRTSSMQNIERVRQGEHVVFEYRIKRPRDGAIRWIRNTDFPITDRTGKVVLIGGIGHDTTELRETELRLQTLMEGIAQLVWRATADGEWTWASPQWTAYTGQSEADSRGAGWLETVHADDRELVRTTWGRAIAEGEFALEYRIVCHLDGSYRWFQTRARPVRNERGSVIEWLGTSTDIHDLRILQERQKVLVGELQHRTRNLLGVVRAVGEQTISSSADLPDFRNRFSDRLASLMRVQGLLSNLHEGDQVSFDDLIHSELTAMNGTSNHVSIEGPQGIGVTPNMVQILAMTLHELATNAVKYGALGQPQAQLAVRWKLESPNGAGRSILDIDWRESGVMMPDATPRARGGGQGRLLIEQALPYQLDAKTTFELGADGVHCTIRIPMPAR